MQGSSSIRSSTVRIENSHFFVDHDTTLHGVHTDTVAFSPTVLIKCSICSYHQSLTRTPSELLKKTIHDTESCFIVMVEEETWTLAGTRGRVSCSRKRTLARPSWPPSATRHLPTIPSPELKAAGGERTTGEIGPKATPPARPTVQPLFGLPYSRGNRHLGQAVGNEM